MIGLLLLMTFIGVVVWLLCTYVPMPQPIKIVIIVFATLFCIILGLQALGMDINSIGSYHSTRVIR